jgi:hypothetical protein
LRDQHRDLAHDRINQHLDGHRLDPRMSPQGLWR